MQITFAVNGDHPEGTGDISHLTRAFMQRNHQPRHQPWGTGRRANPAGEVVVLNTTDDRMRNPNGFLNWLQFRRDTGATLATPAEIVAWNSTAQHLVDLAVSGSPTLPLRVVPTVTAVKHAVAELGGYPVAIFPAKQPAVRPVVLTDAAALTVYLRHPSPDGGVIVQHLPPTGDDTLTKSAVFVGGRHSHTLLHAPLPRRRRIPDPPTLSSDHDAATLMSPRLRDIVTSCVAVRVDYVTGTHPPMITRVNAVDPDLWLRLDVTHIDRFVDAVQQLIDQSRSTPVASQHVAAR